MNFSISLSTAKHLFVDACGVANGSKCNISALDYIHFSLIGGIAEVLGTDTQSIVRQSSPIDAFEDYEICIKANTQILGYYKNPKSSAKLLDEEGFYLSGDIVQRLRKLAHRLRVALHLRRDYLVNRPFA